MQTEFESHYLRAGHFLAQGLEAHSAHWNRLAAKTRQADPLCCRSEWQLAYHEAFQPERNLYLRKSSNGLITFAELPHDSGFRIYTPIEAHWLFGSPLLGPEAPELLEDAMLELGSIHLGRLRPPPFVISGLRPAGALLKRLKTRLGRYFDFRFHNAEELCGASLDGGLDGFLARRSSNLRRNLRKQLKRAEHKGVSFERHLPGAGDDLDALYARMIQVEKSSWKGINHCGMAEMPALTFYRSLLGRLAASKSARIIFARHDERDIGFIFGALADGVYRGQQFSYAHRWQRDSIGNLMQHEQIRWLCEENTRRYDMGPIMDYKHHWTERRYHTQTWVLATR